MGGSAKMFEKLIFARRLYVEFKGMRLALERVATALEFLLLNHPDLKTGGFKSLYNDDKEMTEGEVLIVGDEQFAEQERIEEERKAAGGRDPGFDEDLLKGDFR